MKDYTATTRRAVKLLLVPAIAVAAIAIVLALGRSPEDHAEAAGGGPEMGMFVSSGSTGCPGGTPADHVCVPASDPFTLAIEAIGIPGSGYVGAQTFIVFGEDLVYKIAPAATDEIVWPDCAGAAVRDQLSPESVLHGCLTGSTPPLPVSTHIGNLVELSFTCSPSSTSTEIQLLPKGDPFAGNSGAAFVDQTFTVITAKVTNLIVDCIGPTPTPTDTPIPPTNTPTVTPTATNTPTPLPPPSERPDVKVTKVDLMDPVDADAPYTYRITVESIGLQTAEDVTAEDTLPAGTVFKSYASTAATCSHNAGVVTCDVTDPMAPTDLITIDITVNAPSPVDDTLVSNTVTVESSNEPFANTGNNKDVEETVVLAPRSDVTLQKVGEPTFLDGGEDVTYTLTAKNLGPHTAENVQIVDTLPVGATFVSATNPECGAPSGGQVACGLGSLGVNQEASVQIVLTSPFVTRGTFMKNTAVVSADNELFLQTGNNLAIENTAVIAPPPDLVVSKTDLQDPVLRLGFYSYDITVENQGLGDALDVVVSDTVPTASVQTFAKFLRPATFVSSVGAPCAAISETLVECTIDEINVGQQAVVTINLRAPTTLVDQTITNNVTASASDPDENPAGNQASETTELKACFDVSGDLKVELFADTLLMISKFGLGTGDPGFDVIYDFDGDGRVNLLNDILAVVEHFAQDCSLLL